LRLLIGRSKNSESVLRCPAIAIMLAAYRSGDPYLEFARQVGLVPKDATRKSHPLERDRCKVCCLGLQYLMGERTLAAKLRISVIEARGLIDLHRRNFKTFWRWSDQCVDSAMANKSIHTSFGWRMNVTSKTKARTLRNFPMQANGADMMRLACIYGVEAGVKICAPIHDAFLIEAPLLELDDAVDQMQQAMRRASALVLDGFELATDAKIFRHPERYVDGDGVMWERVARLIAGRTRT